MRSFLFIISFFTTISCIGQQKNPLKNFQAPNNSKVIQSNRIQTPASKLPVKDGMIYLNPDKGSVKSENALQYITEHFELNDYYSFKKFRDEETGLGFHLYAYHEVYKGLTVFGKEILVHITDNSVKRIRGKISNKIELDVTPVISAKNAFQLAKNDLKVTDVSDSLKNELIIYEDKEVFKLAYRVLIQTKSISVSYDVFVDAITGEILNKISNINHENVEVEVETMYSGNQTITVDHDNGLYCLHDSQRNITTKESNTIYSNDSSNYILGSDICSDDPENFTINGYTLSSLNITSLNSSWWYFAIFDENAKPYIKVYDGNGVMVKQTNPSSSYNIYLNLELTNYPYQVKLYEYDAMNSDDYGGSFYIYEENIQNGSNSWTISSYSNYGSYNIEQNPTIAAHDAHWGISKTYDYFLDKFNRSSFDNQNSEIKVGLKRNYGGASWNELNITLGDGGSYFDNYLASIDVIGHEFGHAVDNYAADLEYEGESGALDESFADIYGTVIEHEYKNGNWLIGEEFQSGYFRSMENPNIKGHPDTYNQPGYWKATQLGATDNGGVHSNSGVQNFWFYLLSEGGSGTNGINNQYLVDGIGMDKAIQIAYRNHTTQLTSKSNYYDSYIGSLDATDDLIEMGILTEDDLYSVKQAWYAVGVGHDPDMDCDIVTTEISSPYGSISDGSGNYSNYANNVNCSWVIKPVGANGITVNFTEFDVEEGWDYVKLYNGYDNQGELIAVLTGTVDSTEFYSTNEGVGAMYIEFESDNYINGSGWELNYFTNQGEIYCEGYSILSEPSGIFEDGSGNNNYSNNQTCGWLIAPPCAENISLNIDFLNTQIDHDGIFVYDSFYASEEGLIYSISGSPLPTQMPTLESTTGQLLVIFVSDYSNSGAGFHASYSSTGSIYCNETSLLTDSSGIITDYSLEEEYCNNSECYYLIQPESSSSIELEFTEFELEEPPFENGFYDYIQVFDGDSEESPLIGTYAGSTIPDLIQSSGGSLLIKFKTDILNTYQGWTASWTSIPIEPICSTSHTIKLQSSDSLGWYDNSLNIQIYNNDGSFIDSTITLVDDSIGFYCLDLNSNYCNSFTLNNGDLDIGDSWSLYLSEINLDLNLVTTSTTDFDLGCIYGCTNELSVNFDQSATIDDNSCILPVSGCTDPTAFNFDINANVDDGSCIEIVYGCTDSTAFNFNDEANSDNGTCEEVIFGCTTTEAFNYNQNANTDDEGCIAVSYGCTNPEALNFNASANTDNNNYTTCIFPILGCLDNGLTFEDLIDNITYEELPDGLDDDYKYDINGDNLPALNYNQLANVDDGSCIPTIYGCTDVYSLNYNVNANSDDNTCIPIIFGCMDINADNYHSLVNTDDGSCTYSDNIILICADSTAIASSYFPYGDVESNLYLGDSTFIANEWLVDNSTCLYTQVIQGCTDPTAINYNPNATEDDQSCILNAIYGCLDSTYLEYNDLATLDTDPSSCLNVKIEGCFDITASNYDPQVNTNLSDFSTCEYNTVLGCTNANYIEYWNYDVASQLISFFDTIPNQDDGSCLTEIQFGCTDSSAYNFESNANVNQTNAQNQTSTCVSIVLGCTDTSKFNFDENANTDDGSCIDIILGCMNTEYTEYNEFANQDTEPSSCILAHTNGCTDASATNYNAEATLDDATCEYAVLGCTDVNASNYNAAANTEDGSCLNSNQQIPEGYCMPNMYLNSYTNYIRRFSLDTLDSGYNSSLNQFSSSYTDNSELVVGLEAGSNYSAFVNIISQGTQQGFSGQIGLAILIDYNRDGDFEEANEICFSSIGNSLGNNQNSINYSPTINIPAEIQSGLTKIRVITYLTSDYPSGTNFGCISNFNGEVEDYTANLINDILGCTDLLAENYDAFANTEDGSCAYTGCTNPASINYDSNATIDDYSCVLSTEFNNYDIFLQPFPKYEPIKWSPYGGTTNQILEDYGTSNGAENTDNIIGIYGTEEEYAASYCQNLDLYGFTDWYLPSSDEFGAFSNYFATDWSILDYYSNTEITSWNNSPNPTIGGVFNQPDWTGVYYWTSNESNQEGKANLIKLNPSTSWHDEKSTDHPVRCMRNNAIAGCTDASAENFNQFASINDGTCNYHPNCQNLNFPEGWSIFSTYMIAESMDMSDLLDPIIDNVLISKNNSGAAFLVEWAFNGIGNVLIGQGYQIKTNSVTGFDLCGDYAIPNENPIELVAGWNIVGYLNTEPASASIVLGDIISSDNLLIAKDYMGSAYLPQFNFNGIGLMNPGQGYQIKVLTPDILQY